MSGAKASKCKLFKSTDNRTTWVNVSGVTTVQKPEGSRAEIDMSDLSSDAKEYELDIPDNGTVSFPFNFDGTNTVHQQIVALEASGAKEDYMIEFVEPGAATVTTFAFDAFVTSIALSAALGGKQEGSLNLRVTGATTVAHGATAQS